MYLQKLTVREYNLSKSHRVKRINSMNKIIAIIPTAEYMADSHIESTYRLCI